MRKKRNIKKLIILVNIIFFLLIIFYGIPTLIILKKDKKIVCQALNIQDDNMVYKLYGIKELNNVLEQEKSLKEYNIEIENESGILYKLDCKIEVDLKDFSDERKF